LFGPWHRPYLALYEQRVSFYAKQVANEFPAGAQRDAAVAAANDLRIPYWDWAANNNPDLPPSITNPTASVTRPNGNQVSIPNPLFQYNFHPLTASDFGNFRPFSYWDATKRAPTSTAQNAQSNNGAVVSSLQSQAGSYRSRVYNLMIAGGTYNRVINHGSGSQGDTIEGIHDGIHAVFGSNSHMLYLSFSAHDPVFFLHHANVDRLVAIWQKLHPNTYMQPAVQNGATYTVPQGSTQGPKSPLTPFHKNQNGDFWTSNGVRNHRVFNYEYPELQGNPSQADVRNSVNRLYGTGAAGVAKSIVNKAKRDLFSLDDLDLHFSPDETLQQYIISVAAPLNAMDGPYTTSVFLGDFKENDSASWSTDPNLVGSHTVLGSMTGANNMVYGHIIMTRALLLKYAAGLLDDLDEDTVISYIKDNVHWRVTDATGQIIDEDKIPDLDVQLVSNAIQPKKSESDFPTIIETDLKHGFINSTLGSLQGMGSLGGIMGKPCPDE